MWCTFSLLHLRDNRDDNPQSSLWRSDLSHGDATRAANPNTKGANESGASWGQWVGSEFKNG